MLELRPNCECCDKDLPPDAPDALICTYECTFCASCAADVFGNRCPNCGGAFAPRPVRPPRSSPRLDSPSPQQRPALPQRSGVTGYAAIGRHSPHGTRPWACASSTLCRAR